MNGMFDALEFVDYIRRRWLTIAIACGVALGIALIASLMLPKQYTATASILIQAPAGNDPRAATAVSPVYLESLKSFETLASKLESSATSYSRNAAFWASMRRKYERAARSPWFAIEPDPPPLL